MNKKEIDERGVVLYFAYGSNMNPERMRDRGVVFYSRQRLVLPGYTLKFNKIVSIPNAGAANIIPDENGAVEGILYKVTVRGILNLDKYEHYPHEYDRITLSIPFEGKEYIEVKTYIAHQHKTRENLKPRGVYLDHLLTAEDLLSEDYYNQLKLVETLD